MEKVKKPILLRDYNFNYQVHHKIRSTERFLKELEFKKPVLLKEYTETKSFISDNLKRRNYKNLFEFISYFDTDDGLEILKYFVDMKRISIIISIVMMEEELKLPYFCNGISDFDELMHRYLKVMLYMRRLEMKLPTPLQQEFFDYVNENAISGVAIYTICKSELFAKDIQIGCAYYDGVKDKQQGMLFLSWLLEKYPGREEILIRLADWYLEQGDINMAGKYLEKVHEPSEETKIVIKELKGVK